MRKRDADSGHGLCEDQGMGRGDAASRLGMRKRDADSGHRLCVDQGVGRGDASSRLGMEMGDADRRLGRAVCWNSDRK